MVRRFYDAFSRGRPIEEVGAEFESYLHPNAEYVNPPDAVEPGTRRGRSEFRGALESIAEGLGHEAKFTIDSLEERAGRLLVILSIQTGGTVSGVEVAGPTIGAVWTVEDGLVRRLQWCWDPSDARAIFERQAD